MLQNEKLSQTLIFLGLAGLMAVTRMNHFGSMVSLPDASLAVFFLAGFFFTSWWAFPLLFLEALVIDLIVTSVGGVSSFCITPAYLFLIPSYAVMMAAGISASNYSNRRAIPILRVSFSLVAASLLAFFISNLGFYLFSGRFEAMAWFEYSSKVAHYFPAYLISTGLYCVLILSIAALLSNPKDKDQANNYSV